MSLKTCNIDIFVYNLSLLEIKEVKQDKFFLIPRKTCVTLFFACLDVLVKY